MNLVPDGDPPFLFDENLSQNIVRAFSAIGEPVTHVRDIPHLGSGSSDSEILDFAEEHGYRLVTQDQSIHEEPHRQIAMLENDVGVYVLYFSTQNNPNFWEIWEFLVRRWQEVRDHAQTTSPPYMMRLARRQPLERLR